MANKYQPKYEHNYFKLDVAEALKKLTPKQKQNSANAQQYNAYYKLLKSGNRSSEILKELDNLQDKINGKNI
jgi:hypothetical protein|tara:strand:+ start:410 stop:625 length:216 start_codon:yes stop_codon:yes gene_type:complete